MADQKIEALEYENSENITSGGTIEVKLDNGDTTVFPTFKARRMILYHGTGISGIKEFRESIAATIGAGVYLTSDFGKAVSYSLLRAESDSDKFTVYVGEIRTMNLLDLTEADSWLPLGRIMTPILEEEKVRTDFPDDWQQYHKDSVHRAAERALERIKSGTIRGPKDVLYNFGGTTRRLFSGLGFDGIKAIEGGEGWTNYNTTGDHDTFVIFDPTKVKILQEIQVASYLPKRDR